MNRTTTLALAGLLLLVSFPVGGNAQGGPITIAMRCTHTATTHYDTVDMETGYHGFFDCWAHYGIHTYFVGRDTVYALRGGSGAILSVERIDSPPIEFPGLTGALPIETSLDGKTWTLVGTIPLALGNNGFVSYSFTGNGEEFRFIRIREPLSAAQGLSGYLDISRMDLVVDIVGPAPVPTLTAQQGVQKTCEYDIMEDVWSIHPCWYGAVEHFDSPSWWHTYFLGNSSLDAIHGSATALYFRLIQQGQPVANILTGTLLIQTSVDGMTWDTVGTQPITYGVPATFDVTGLNQKEAKFVRIATDKHPQFFGPTADFRHAEGFLVDSDISLDGMLP